jgi:hypothetical protein
MKENEFVTAMSVSLWKRKPSKVVSSERKQDNHKTKEEINVNQESTSTLISVKWEDLHGMDTDTSSHSKMKNQATELYISGKTKIKSLRP